MSDLVLQANEQGDGKCRNSGLGVLTAAAEDRSSSAVFHLRLTISARLVLPRLSNRSLIRRLRTRVASLLSMGVPRMLDRDRVINMSSRKPLLRWRWLSGTGTL